MFILMKVQRNLVKETHKGIQVQLQTHQTTANDKPNNDEIDDNNDVDCISPLNVIAAGKHIENPNANETNELISNNRLC